MRILLIDDHPLFREGLVFLLKQLNADVDVVESGSCEEALALPMSTDGFEIVLVDIYLPGMSGLEGIAHLKQRFETARIVVLTSSENAEMAVKAIALGAFGYIPKTTKSKVMLGALRLILDGGMYLPPHLLALIHNKKQTDSDQMAENGDFSTKSAKPHLSSREMEVLRLIAEGFSGKEIGSKLNLSPNTVKAHTTSVLRALNVTTRAQVIVAANRLGLL